MATVAEAVGAQSRAGEASGAAPPIRLATRVSYGAGAVANGIKNAAFTSYLLFFYTQIIGVPAGIVAARSRSPCWSTRSPIR